MVWHNGCWRFLFWVASCTRFTLGHFFNPTVALFYGLSINNGTLCYLFTFNVEIFIRWFRWLDSVFPKKCHLLNIVEEVNYYAVLIFLLIGNFFLSISKMLIIRAFRFIDICPFFFGCWSFSLIHWTSTKVSYDNRTVLECQIGKLLWLTKDFVFKWV